ETTALRSFHSPSLLARCARLLRGARRCSGRTYAGASLACAFGGSIRCTRSSSTSSSAHIGSRSKSTAASTAGSGSTTSPAIAISLRPTACWCCALTPSSSSATSSLPSRSCVRASRRSGRRRGRGRVLVRAVRVVARDPIAEELESIHERAIAGRRDHAPRLEDGAHHLAVGFETIFVRAAVIRIERVLDRLELRDRGERRLNRRRRDAGNDELAAALGERVGGLLRDVLHAVIAPHIVADFDRLMRGQRHHERELLLRGQIMAFVVFARHAGTSLAAEPTRFFAPRSQKMPSGSPSAAPSGPFLESAGHQVGSRRRGAGMGDGFLLVEDDALCARALRGLLLPHGAVAIATTASEARSAMSAQPWAGLVLDVLMPDGNGLDVLDGERAKVRAP